MNARHRTLFSLATATALLLPLAAQAEIITSAVAPGQCLTNSGGTPSLQPCTSKNNAQAFSMNYVAGPNEFYGQFRVNGQCLDAAGARLAFATCKSGDAQIWKLSGNTGKINNGAGNCITVSGSSVTTASCNQGGKGMTWYSAGVKVYSVPGMETVTVGTALTLKNGNLMNGTKIVAGGAGNIVAGGAGNIVAGGAGNIVAGGAGN
jgi:phosphate-selective porin